MAKREPTWQVTYERGFLCDGSLPPAQKAILLALAGWADLHFRADCTKAQLAESSGVGERQMWGHLQELRKRGYIQWETVRLHGKNRNIYELLSPCGIRMVKRGGVSMQFPHGSLHKKISPPAELLPAPTGLLKTPPHPPPTSSG